LPALAADQYENFYYSPHAGVVFASQAGPVEIWWVSFSPEGAGNGAWQFRRETFNVSGDTRSAPVRRIYWTERSFDGPHVTIPNGRIEKANPIYTSKFPPTVAVAYQPPGYVEDPDPAAQAADIKRTLWFEKLAGVSQLSAYNMEGRILIEYLGGEVSPGQSVFLGLDVVEVIKSISPITTLTTELGKEVLPLGGQAGLVGTPAATSMVGQQPFYATTSSGDGTLHYFAERENSNPDLVMFYWMGLSQFTAMSTARPNTHCGGRLATTPSLAKAPVISWRHWEWR
jgi:hypothetical protein